MLALSCPLRGLERSELEPGKAAWGLGLGFGSYFSWAKIAPVRP